MLKRRGRTVQHHAVRPLIERKENKMSVSLDKSIVGMIRLSNRNNKWTIAKIAGGICGRIESIESDIDADDVILWIVKAAISGRAMYEDEDGVVPIIVGYDIMRDISPLWKELSERFFIFPLARSPRDVFRLSMRLKTSRKKRTDILFWDMRHIDKRGIPVILPEARTTCEVVTGLFETLQSTAANASEYDVRELGSTLLTMTGITRTIAANKIGKLSYLSASGKTRTLLQDYRRDAAKEFSRDYNQYAMRKACSRGGFTFCASKTAMMVRGRTIAIDETSAHHAQACGRFVPESFKQAAQSALQRACDTIVRRTVDEVLAMYKWPFPAAIHAEVEFKDLRLRHGSVFERQGIGLISMQRFALSERVDGTDEPASEEAIRGVRAAGYRDRVENGIFAFAKLMSADKLVTWINEQELWCMSQVYEWSDMQAIRGEMTGKRTRPDDLAILTSMLFYDEKQKAKAKLAKSTGTERRKLESEYVSQIKASFNAVGYGIHAQDEMQPSFDIDETGEWKLRPAASVENFNEYKPRRPRAWYTYGMRIAGGARMQMILAIELLDRKFKDKISILYGDTDSLKIETRKEYSELIEALVPLHDATRQAILETTSRARKLWPEHISELEGVGEFVFEEEFLSFYAGWTKCTAGLRKDKSIDLTLAGVPRGGEWSFATWIAEMTSKYGFHIIRKILTFDFCLAPNLSQVVSITYNDDGFAEYETVPYTLASTLEADHSSTLSYMRSLGRNIIDDPSAYAYWDQNGAAVLETSDRVWRA